MDEFMDYLEMIVDACCEIRDAGACDKCPLGHNCIEDTEVLVFADCVPKRALAEFFELAENAENSEQDFNNYEEWLKTEMERELWND